MRNQLLLAVSLAALGLTGCVSSGTIAKVEAIDQNRKAVDRNTRAVLASGRATVTNDVTAITIAESKQETAEAQAEAHYAELKATLEAQQKQFQSLVTGVLALAGETVTDAVPGGAVVGKVIGIINTNVKNAQEAVATAKKESEAAKATAEKTKTEAAKAIEDLKTELAAKETLLKKELEIKAAQQKQDSDFALKQFAALSDNAKAETRVELIKLANEKGIKDPEKLSTGELLAALSASGVGLAGLLRTFGRSRSADAVNELVANQGTTDQEIAKANKQVDEIWDNFTHLGKKVAVLEQQITIQDPSSLRLTVAKHEAIIDDHERRLDVIDGAFSMNAPRGLQAAGR